MRLQKQPDAWSEGVPLPLAFDCNATKVFSVPHGIGIGDQNGCQARVFYNPTRPKSEPKSVIMNVIEIEMTLDTAMATFNFKL